MELLIDVDAAEGWSCAGDETVRGRIPAGGMLSRITAAAFSPDGRQLVVAYHDVFLHTLLAFFDVSVSGAPALDVEATACFQTTEPDAPIAHAGRGPVRALRFSPDGGRLATAGRDGGGAVFVRGDARGWRPEQYQLVAQLRSELDSFVGIAWQDDDTLLTASEDGSLKRWSLAGRTFTGASPSSAASPPDCDARRETALEVEQSAPEAWALNDAQGNRITRLRARPLVSPCGSYILDWSERRRGELLDGAGQPLTALHGPPGERWLRDMRFTPDEAYLTSGGEEPDRAWPLAAGAILRAVNDEGLPAPVHRFASAELARFGIRD
jgi:WD40 repeat protein